MYDLKQTAPTHIAALVGKMRQKIRGPGGGY
jgi:hypothetical protein